MDPLHYFGTEADGLDPMAGRPIRDPSLHRADDLAGHRRVADQRRAAASRRDALGGAAHVDVHTVETQFAHDLRYLVEQIRLGAVDLGHDRPLDPGVPKLLPRRLSAVADLVPVD